MKRGTKVALFVLLTAMAGVMFAHVGKAESVAYRSASRDVVLTWPSLTVAAGERFWVSVAATEAAAVNPTVTAYTNASMEATGCDKIGFVAYSTNVAAKGARWAMLMGNGETATCAFSVLTVTSAAEVPLSGSVSHFVQERSENPVAAFAGVAWLLWAGVGVVALTARNEAARVVAALAGLGVLFMPLTGGQFVMLGLLEAGLLLAVVYGVMARGKNPYGS